jgi:hypothetical protein
MLKSGIGPLRRFAATQQWSAIEGKPDSLGERLEGAHDLEPTYDYARRNNAEEALSQDNDCEETI